ncbi:MAG: cytochrome C-binding protein [Betaproteobacteria bacterium]|nr:cytochrome C-binding protein [Betaproteobacteria bacterium]
MAGSFTAAADELPAWAFVVNPPGGKPPADDGTLHHVPGSDRAFTLSQLRDLFNVPDWHRDDHPPMPDVVAHGRRPDVYACAFCHLPNGLGRPENASLAGLPAEYMVKQVEDFRSGARRSSEPRSVPVNFMIHSAQHVSDADVRAAADYFSKLASRQWIRVVESAEVPKTHVAGWMLMPSEHGAMEPIGHRIVEIPEDVERTELRDSQSGFIAYVPPGSIDRGRILVTTGDGGRFAACGTCHGAGLEGLGPVPGLAGRSPSYIVRQLFDLRNGARNGTWSALMKPVVSGLSDDDIIAIAAYTASLGR